MKRGWIIRVLERMERWMYRNADHIVTVGKGYRNNILKKVNVDDRISIITNGVDPEQFVPTQRSLDLVERFHLQGRFVCSYVGTVGLAHGLDVVVRAAKRMKTLGREEIVFLVVGGGAKLDELREVVEQNQLGRFYRPHRTPRKI